MFWERLRHFLYETCRGVRGGAWGVVTSVGAITVAVLVTGIFLLLTINLGTVVAQWAEDFQVVVFLRDDITPQQLTLVRKRLDGELAVRAVTFVSKEQDPGAFRRQLRGQESLLEELGGQWLPS